MTTKQLAFKSLPQLAIAEGATTPSPGATANGVWAWSTTLSKPLYWTGTSWTAGSPDPLELSTSNPAAPAAGKVRVFGRNVGGRIMPAFKGPSGLDSSLQASLARNRIAWANPLGGGSTIATSAITLAATGSFIAEGVATTNLYTAMKRAVVTAAVSTTAVAGLRSTFTQYFRGALGGKIGGFHFVCRFGPATGQSIQTTRRGFCGFTSLFAASTDVNPSTLPHVLGVGCDAIDANYFIMHRTGTLAVTKIDTGISKSAADASKVYELAMFCAPGSSTVEFEFTDLTTDVVFRHTANTNLPSPDALLGPQVYYSVGGISGPVGTALMSMYIETDY